MIPRRVRAFMQRRSGRHRDEPHLELTTSFFAEDILLARLLKTTSSGTYVDVGANHPIEGSNTYRLYMQGWSGLTIDPNPAFASDYGRLRPRDTHVVVGISAVPSSMTYHHFDPDVFNTLSTKQASIMVGQGRRKIGESTVSCLPLSDVIGEHLGDRPIDILNVDCEGMDIDAIESLQTATNRPMVIVVEDYAGFMSLRERAGQSEMDQCLRGHGYAPIAQSAWSAIFVARDWRDLIQRSDAFDRVSIQRGYMPA